MLFHGGCLFGQKSKHGKNIETKFSELTAEGLTPDIIEAFSPREWIHIGTASQIDVDKIIQHIYLILCVRVVALLLSRGNIDTKFNDITTGSIRFEGFEVDIIDEIIPKDIQFQLFQYVDTTLRFHRDVHYHSIHHVYHVVKSANKLLDMLLQKDMYARPRATFGIRSNALQQFAFIFAAMIHDVDHRGISNAQLVVEEHELAILYNDNSVAENNSLAIAFGLLGSPDFSKLKNALFTDATEYRSFRKTVLDLVLCTDISSPERTQIIKSKWNAAFGETPERKVMKELMVQQMQMRLSSSTPKANQTGEVKSTNKTLSRLQQKLSETDLEKANMDWIESGHGGKRPLLDAFNKGRGSMGVGFESTDLVDMYDFNQKLIENDYISLSPSELSVDNNNEEYEELIEDIHPSICEVDLGNSMIDLRTEQKDEPIERGIEINKNNLCTQHLGSATHETKRASIEPSKRSMGLSSRSRGSIRSSIKSNISERDTFLKAVNDLEATEMGQSLRSRGSIRSSLKSNKSERDAFLKAVHDLEASENTVYECLTELDARKRSSFQSQGSFKSLIYRRLSAPLASNGFHQRPKPSQFVSLGIKRAIDLSGTILIPFEPSQSIAHGHMDSNVDNDEVDEFKASVVLEHMLKAADISSLMQDWECTKKWCSYLFFEMKDAYENDRLQGVDPALNWFDNQIVFFDRYVIPLANRLDECGVFGSYGQQFKSFALENRRLWIEEGEKDLMDWLMTRWKKIKSKKK